jgi:hypothetical protein
LGSTGDDRIQRGTLFAPAEGRYNLPAMPDILSALIAFVAEHRRCGDLEGGLEVGVVWLNCSCSARLARPAEPPAQAGGPGRG